ncbi:tRNA (adenosine(37)-N6)-dimethylallyltransferase MiaA [Candidatus Peregrinibacteria bacterium]|nr:tRNA (adenosine(37)-N6)-dimethylallyltransferase MiaA [Candidatus Peregrinibacteria bacterium]
MHSASVSKVENFIAEIEIHLAEAKQLGLIPLIAVIGPTCSGKTALGIALAHYFSGEIVSADSRQIYRYLNIGTAKATPEEQAEAVHHLIDLINPDQAFSLSDYQRLAFETIKKIHSTGKTPILVGGTGLYISAVTQNYQLPESAPDPELRAQLTDYAESHGPEALHQKLVELDPLAAARIHPNNLRYVIRAIEIISQTSQPKTNQRAAAPFATFFISIDWPREILYQKINQRIDEQMDMGLLNETRELLGRYAPTLPALSSLGYQELATFLRGETSLEKALEDFKQNTRNYAKRQLTWFRKYSNVYSVDGMELAEFIKALKAKAQL